MSGAVAVVPVRDGEPVTGGREAVLAAAGDAVLVGDGCRAAARSIDELGLSRLRLLEQAAYRPGAWAHHLAPHLDDRPLVLLPSSPDGRDLAPRLAATLGRPLVAGALSIGPTSALVSRWGGRSAEEIPLDGAAVVTLQPGLGEPCRGVAAAAPVPEALAPREDGQGPPRDPTVRTVLPPDVATMDLSEAPRIVGGGAGLGDAATLATLGRVAAALGASLGATRVVTDAGWLGHERQIGTTGVVVSPRLYLAFGVSGAVQHTSGLGQPAHVVSVNLDPHCPMMTVADLALVADAPAVVRHLAARLGVATEGSGDA